MSSYNKTYLEQIAKEKGFVRDNLEKVIRLSEILRYFNQSEFILDNATVGVFFYTKAGNHCQSDENPKESM